MTVLWVAQAVTVTNGDNEVIVTSAPGNAITKIETSATFHGVGFSLPYEIERTYNNGTNDVIVLYENWAGSSGSIAAVAVPSGAAVTRAADSLDALKTVYESLADSVSTTAVANGIPKYSSQGRLKATAGVASDDVMVKSQFSDGAFGPDCRTLGLGIYYNADAALIARSTESNLLSGLYTAYSPNNANASIGVAPIPTDAGAYSLLNMQGVSSDDEFYTTQLSISYAPNLNGIFFRSRASGSFGNWNKIYHSGNTNFNTWSVGAGRVLSHRSIAVNPTSIDVELELHSRDLPTGITIDIGSCDIIDTDTGTTVYSDVTPTLAPPSHRKLAILRFAVTGASTGKLYRVIARSSGFGFTVTF